MYLWCSMWPGAVQPARGQRARCSRTESDGPIASPRSDSAPLLCDTGSTALCGGNTVVRGAFVGDPEGNVRPLPRRHRLLWTVFAVLSTADVGSVTQCQGVAGHQVLPIGGAQQHN